MPMLLAGIEAVRLARVIVEQSPHFLDLSLCLAQCHDKTTFSADLDATCWIGGWIEAEMISCGTRRLEGLATVEACPAMFWRWVCVLRPFPREGG